MTFFYDSIVVVVAVLFCIFRHTNFHFAIHSLSQSQRKKSHFPNAYFDAPFIAYHDIVSFFGEGRKQIEVKGETEGCGRI